MSSPDSIELALARIEVKLDTAIKGQDDHETRLRLVEGHNTGSLDARVNALERWRYAFPSIASLALLIAAVSLIVAILKS
jgi:hypothetical protein